MESISREPALKSLKISAASSWCIGNSVLYSWLSRVINAISLVNVFDLLWRHSTIQWNGCLIKTYQISFLVSYKNVIDIRQYISSLKINNLLWMWLQCILVTIKIWFTGKRVDCSEIWCGLTLQSNLTVIVLGLLLTDNNGSSEQSTETPGCRLSLVMVGSMTGYRYCKDFWTKILKVIGYEVVNFVQSVKLWPCQ